MSLVSRCSESLARWAAASRAAQAASSCREWVVVVVVSDVAASSNSAVLCVQYFALKLGQSLLVLVAGSLLLHLDLG